MTEKIVAHYCAKAGGHLDAEGVCGSHWIAEVIVRPREGVDMSDVRLGQIADDIWSALSGEF